MKCFFALIFLILVPWQEWAQPDRLPEDRQRLLLELSSGFYNVLSLGQINLDSSLIAASISIKMRRTPVILDGINEDLQGIEVNWIDQRDPASAKARLKKLTGPNHMKMLLLLGAYYSFQSGKNSSDADTALAYLFKAQKETESLKSRFWQNQVNILLAKTYLKKWDTRKGDEFTKLVIQNCQTPEDQSTLAKACYYYATYCPFIPDTTALRIVRLEQAAKIYHGLKNYTGEIISVTYYTYLTFASGDVARSTKGAHRALVLQDSIKFPYTQFIQDQLAYISDLTGDHITMLSHALSEVDVAERTGLDFQMSLFYARLGSAYQHLDPQDPKGDFYLRKALDAAIQKGGLSIGYDILFSVSSKLVQQNKPDQAFKLINSFISKFPPTNVADQQTVYQMLGFYYATIKNKSAAEKNYLAAVALEDQTIKITNSQAGRSYFHLGHFYTENRTFDKAKIYLDKYVANPTHTVPDLDYSSTAQKDLAVIDSAQGNFASAYQHMLKHIELYDKVYNATQLKALENLKIKYETREKEQSIKLLQAKGSADRAELQKVGLQRNLTLAGILGLIVISGLVYNGYRNKRRSNLLLNAQQREINDKNTSLEKIVTEKDELLYEKDLLLKEVHHRVKNNLHIVMSLLESQSAYLKDNAALGALLESQNRVQAIALIHQKLYSSDNITQVDMQSYIPELIDYLNESLSTFSQHIIINQHIEPVYMDVSQAIPVGIILNEAVTNAIKYAFPLTQKGEVNVRMSYVSGLVDLEISDNGVGFPSGFDFQKANSLGMNLMKGLINQLKGTFKVSASDGVNIRIKFSLDHMSVLN